MPSMDASAGEFMSTSTRRDLIRNAAVLGVGGLSANDPLLSAIEATKLAGQDRTSADFFPGFKKDKKAVSGQRSTLLLVGLDQDCCSFMDIPRRTSCGEKSHLNSPRNSR